jgi:hypothetical protein
MNNKKELIHVVKAEENDMIQKIQLLKDQIDISQQTLQRLQSNSLV